MTSGAEAGLLPDGTALERAARRIEPHARRTPLHPSPWLSERAGVPVHLKLECWQRTHSFKLRGALNAVAALVEGGSDGAEPPHLVTASAGNHGLALAHAAALHGLPATVFVPTGAPAAKKARIRRAGAGLREVEGIYDDAAAAARAFADAPGRTLLHPFDDPDVVAGQGTVALEILEQLPDVAEVVVPVGGGGLAAGVGAALAAGDTGARARGVQSDATRAMHAAFEAGGVVPVEDRPTLCDGLAGETESRAYARARAALHDLTLVREATVAPAVRSLFVEEGIVAEGSGAVGVAALLDGRLTLDGPTVVVVSGGNIDASRLARILMEEDPWHD